MAQRIGSSRAFVKSAVVVVIALLVMFSLLKSAPLQSVKLSSDARCNPLQPQSNAKLMTEQSYDENKVLQPMHATGFRYNRNFVVGNNTMVLKDGKPLIQFVHALSECVFMSYQIVKYGGWEKTLVRDILNVMHDLTVKQGLDELFVDIGGNIGGISLPVAYAGYNVIAFEPMMYNAELYAATVGHNGLQNQVRLYLSAVADSDDLGDMCTVPFDSAGGKNRGNGRLVPLSECEKLNITDIDRVPVHKIDTILAKETRCVAALKADIEGFELRAFEGAENTLFKSRCRPCVVWLEYNENLVLKSGRQPSEVGAFFSEKGYRCLRSKNEAGIDSSSWLGPADYACYNVRDEERCGRILENKLAS
mmetsp:Transcript_15573/g.41938  ORF Transcript_15573/g.41938 Transcript_15573/m.41938 type:complete len:363 (+) Transcript_15573:122-1210(+)